MPKNLRFSTIFSNSTMSKITFVALRRFIYPPGRWGSFGAIGYRLGLQLRCSPRLYTLHPTLYACSSAAIPAFNLSPITFNLSMRLSSDEQRLPTLRRQQTATSPMLRQQGNFALDHLHHHHQLDCGGW